jgi:ABC-type multidrug transport system permease subunit
MKIKKFGLTLTLLFLFLISVGGQFIFGFKAYNDERKKEHLAHLENQIEYLKSGHFISSISENMESEFLQMGLFVILTVYLYQQGSSESKKLPEEKTEKDLEKEAKEKQFNQKMRRRWPFWWRLYENSLTIALLSLFLIFFFLHAYGSLLHINEQKVAQGESPLIWKQIFTEPEFWFESFQNWQSEFFAIISLSLLSIFLRQKDSAQSKQMSDPFWKTGSD